MKANRNNRRPGGGKPPKPLAQLKGNLQRLSTQALAVVLDATVEVLRERGVAVRLWNEKGRSIQKFGYIGGMIYALVPQGRQEPEEVDHGESGENTGGGAPGA